jgi:hypothetical protein
LVADVEDSGEGEELVGDEVGSELELLGPGVTLPVVWVIGFAEISGSDRNRRAMR